MKYLQKLIIQLIFISIVIIYGQTDNYYEYNLLPNDPDNLAIFGATMVSTQNEVIIYGNQSFFCFQQIDTNWVEYQSISVIDDCPLSFKIGLSNDKLIIGSPNTQDICGDGNSGKVHLYNKVAGFWLPNTILQPANTDVSQFGQSLFIEHELIAIKSHIVGSSGWESLIHVFRFDGEYWNEEAVIPNPGGGTSFGNSLLILENSLFVSDAGYNNYTGIVYIYEYYEGDWLLSNTISSSDPIENNTFGYEIFFNNNELFISALGHPFYPDNPGQVHVFQWDGSEWMETQILTSSDAEIGDRFGAYINGYDNTIVISAWGNDDAGSGSGSSYIFKKIYNTWFESKKVIPSDSQGADFFGVSLAMNNDYVFIGADNKNGMEGAAYVYNPHDTTLHANFAGDVHNGNGPLTVQFTSVPQGNPTAYEWDFNSDGYIDSTEPHPEFTYQIDGIYTVTLTVYDETGSDPETKEDYIQVNSEICFGDLTGDCILDVSDLVLYVAFVLGEQEPTEEQFITGDVDYSGQIDIIDIVMVIGQILGWELVKPAAGENSTGIADLLIKSNTVSIKPANAEISGIELHLSGEWQLTDILLPVDWQFHHNDHTMLIFSTTGQTLTSNTDLFSFDGELNIEEMIIADSFGQKMEASQNIISPTGFEMHQPYPNPFNPVTNIRYDVINGTNVSINIIDLNGKVVTNLVDSFHEPGYYQIEWNARERASGIYFIFMTTGTGLEFKQKILLLK